MTTPQFPAEQPPQGPYVPASGPGAPVQPSMNPPQPGPAQPYAVPQPGRPGYPAPQHGHQGYPAPQGAPSTFPAPQPAAAAAAPGSRLALFAVIALGVALALTLAQSAMYLTMMYGPGGGYRLYGITSSVLSITQTLVLIAALVLSILTLRQRGSGTRTRTTALITLGAAGFAIVSALPGMIFWF